MDCSEMGATTLIRVNRLTAPQCCIYVSCLERLETGMFRDACNDSYSCITFNNTYMLPLCFVFRASRN